MSTPSVERVGKALEYLVETDEPLGALYAAQDAGSFLLKHLVARLGLESGEKSAAARQEQALASDEYVTAIEALQETVAEYRHMEAKRKTESLLIDVWRSVNASKRQGNI